MAHLGHTGWVHTQGSQPGGDNSGAAVAASSVAMVFCAGAARVPGRLAVVAFAPCCRVGGGLRTSPGCDVSLPEMLPQSMQPLHDSTPAAGPPSAMAVAAPHHPHRPPILPHLPLLPPPPATYQKPHQHNTLSHRGPPTLLSLAHAATRPAALPSPAWHVVHHTHTHRGGKQQ